MSRLTAEARRLDSEPATALLLADCYGKAASPNERSHASFRYRRKFGILFPEQLDSIANVEFTCEDMHGVGGGIFWRASPVGRTLRSDEQRAKGASYYHP